MNQHEFVARCYTTYAKLGLEPGNPDDGCWQDAHYPAPCPEGTSIIPLLYNDHQIQGLLQSEEYERCCFWVGDAKRFLLNCPFVEDWFELWDLYERWKGNGMGKMNKSLTLEARSVNAKKAVIGRKERDPKKYSQFQKAAGMKGGSQLFFICTVTGHLSNATGMGRYHQLRSIDPKSRTQLTPEELAFITVWGDPPHFDTAPKTKRRWYVSETGERVMSSIHPGEGWTPGMTR